VADCRIECELIVVEASMARPDWHDVHVTEEVGRSLCALAQAGKQSVEKCMVPPQASAQRSP
jgi:hypothetical protein